MMCRLFLWCYALVLGAFTSSIVSCTNGDKPAVSETHVMGQQDTLPHSFCSPSLGVALQAWVDSHVAEPAMQAAIRGHYRSTDSLIWLHGAASKERVEALHTLLSKAQTHGLEEYMSATLQAVDREVKAFNADNLSDAKAFEARIASYELTLSRAYLRYVAALRYGCIDPFLVLNYYPQQVRPSVVRPKYPRYYDHQPARPDSAFYAMALTAGVHGATAFAERCMPASAEYDRLRQALAKPEYASQYPTIRVNMERLRWRLPEDTLIQSKRVWVNIPAQSLEAIDASGQVALRMRVCYGDSAHRTPILASHIVRAELNPDWTVPPSILNNDIAVRYVGRSGYFASQRMRAYERATNKEVDPASLSADQWRSGKYRLTQTGGDGGALGRIVFRFDNAHSIYLHDTNQRGAFQRTRRDVSHGCVRVQQPYELAQFLLTKRDSLYEAQIAYTIGRSTDEAHQPKQPLTRVRYDRVPLAITYFTAWPYREDSIAFYPDVYGYDALMLKAMGRW